MKRAYLSVYDYGAGGLWLVVLAPSRKAIERKYPFLDVLEGRPEWMTDAFYRGVVDRHLYDVDAAPETLLRCIVDEVASHAVPADADFY
jgi:hypothetical protein